MLEIILGKLEGSPRADRGCLHSICSAMRRVLRRARGTLLAVTLGQGVPSGHRVAARHPVRCFLPLPELSWHGKVFACAPCSS